MALLQGLENSAKGGSFFGGFCQGAITSFAGGVVGSAVSGAVDGAFGMSATAGAANLGISALSGAIAGGITGSLMGGDFWSGFVSGGVGGFLGVEDLAKGNDFLAHIKNWFNGAFGQFVASGGKYQFSLSDALELCGAKDAIDEAEATVTEPALVDVSETKLLKVLFLNIWQHRQKVGLELYVVTIPKKKLYRKANRFRL